MGTAVISHRAGQRTRQQWRDARLRVLKANAGVLALSGGLVLAVAVAGAWWGSHNDETAVGGFLLGVIVTAFIAMVCWVTDVMSGAHNAKFGTYGESNTTQLFRTRSTRRQGWRIVDSIPFDSSFGDVDHVACGPAGVIAIETKWTNIDWKLADGRLVAGGRDPLRQARTSANKIRLLLRSKRFDVDVLPVLIVWGPGSFAPDFAPRVVEGVVVVNGPTAADFTSRIAEFTDSSASPEEVEAMTLAIRDYVSRFEDPAANVA